MYGLTKAVRACTTGKRKLKRPPHLALSPGGGPPRKGGTRNWAAQSWSSALRELSLLQQPVEPGSAFGRDNDKAFVVGNCRPSRNIRPITGRREIGSRLLQHKIR